MSDQGKRLAAQRAIQYVKAGQVVGLGTGSTAKYAIEEIALRVREGLKITAVPTSVATAQLAIELGIPLAEMNEAPVIDISIDGADEVDESLRMIKGGGGALTREKLVAISTLLRINIVDETKLVARLGEAWPVPVEVLQFAWTKTAEMLRALGCTVNLRVAEDKPYVTDNGNYILDCKFPGIDDPTETEAKIKLTPGVIESGLFVNIADVLVVGFDDHTEIRERVP